jgi:curved DNA-binding protein CbpA
VKIDAANVDPRNTYYKLLLVDPSADAEIVGAVYKRLARRFHPDVDSDPEAAQRMAALNEAYEVLSNPELRARYDAALAVRRDRRITDRPARNRDAPSFGEAGPPVGPPWGSVVDFGRYRGWTLGQIRRRDPDFLEWLLKMPVGRTYRGEITTLLRRSA